MRPYSTLLIITVLIFTSCDKIPVLPLTENLVTSVNAYDLDNNGNSSDIRVDFNVRDNNNVFEYRIMIIPSSSSSSFTADLASGIPESNYLEVNTVPFETKYPISRLPSNLLDIKGDQIINGVEYVVAIFVFGTGSHQLSEFSRPFRLIEQGIYSGDYEGVYSGEIIKFVSEIPCPIDIIGPFDMKTTIVETGQANYSGTLICTSCNFRGDDQGLISFIISNNVISNFIFIQTIPCYVDPDAPCVSCVLNVDPCDANFTGQGITTGELGLSIAFSGDDCFGSSENTLILFRQ